ncbi:MAG: aminoglycoside phosphotransferase family protein, partial [Pseudomonadota bacterium]
FETTSAWLRPVRHRGRACMLKCPKSHSDEQRSAEVLMAWGGPPAARILLRAGPVHVVERADPGTPLEERDPEAHRVLAATLAELHGRGGAVAGLQDLRTRFASLWTVEAQDPRLMRAAETARRLLSEPAEMHLLHGDYHHGNLLRDRHGWTVIDPKGVMGPRAYDAANALCNPVDDTPTAAQPDRLRSLSQAFSETMKEPADRLLAHALAHAGLSASWTMRAGGDPRHMFAMIEALGRL